MPACRMRIFDFLDNGRRCSKLEIQGATLATVTSGRFKHHCVAADCVRFVLRHRFGDEGNSRGWGAIPGTRGRCTCRT